MFWFGLLLILLFSVTLHWLPSLGRGTLAHLVLPAVTLATYELALYLRLFNSALATEARHDYVRTAYAKGQSRTKVILRHMLPNALLPLVTIAGINLGLLLGGTVVTETVFSWPGVGRLIVQSVASATTRSSSPACSSSASSSSSSISSSTCCTPGSIRA